MKKNNIFIGLLTVLIGLSTQISECSQSQSWSDYLSSSFKSAGSYGSAAVKSAAGYASRALSSVPGYTSNMFQWVSSLSDSTKLALLTTLSIMLDYGIYPKQIEFKPNTNDILTHTQQCKILLNNLSPNPISISQTEGKLENRQTASLNATIKRYKQANNTVQYTIHFHHKLDNEISHMLKNKIIKLIKDEVKNELLPTKIGIKLQRDSNNKIFAEISSTKWGDRIYGLRIYNNTDQSLVCQASLSEECYTAEYNVLIATQSIASTTITLNLDQNKILILSHTDIPIHFKNFCIKPKKSLTSKSESPSPNELIYLQTSWQTCEKELITLIKQDVLNEIQYFTINIEYTKENGYTLKLNEEGILKTEKPTKRLFRHKIHNV